MASEFYPFYFTDRVTFGAAGTGTLTLTVGATEEFIGEEMIFVVSSGTFAIEGIRDSSGKAYSSASVTDPIPSAALVTTIAQRTNIGKFSAPLQLVPNTVLTLDVTGGTSGATLDIIVRGKKRTVVS